ncbi:MAG: hypothetical protein ACRDDZ_10660 [Marinifilaceae bacterium]
METTYKIVIVLAGTLPLFSGLTWLLVILFSLKNCITKYELRVKQAQLYFVLITSVVWFATFTYGNPQLHTYISSLAIGPMMLATIFYYKFLKLVTKGDCDFSRLHFIAALIIFCSMLISNVYIYQNILLERLIRLGYSSTYLLLSVKLLIPYYRVINFETRRTKKHMRWIVVLFASPFLSTLLYLCPFVVFSLNELILSIVIGIIVLYALVNSIIGYSILSRRFLFYAPSPNLDTVKSDKIEVTTNTLHENRSPKRRISEVFIDESGRHIVMKLTKQRFEQYMHDNKPYLNPQLKITDLIEPLKANRTFISNFVNKTYDLNFNQYINCLRLQELERISHLPSNANKKRLELVREAGFATMRNYTRALTTEQNNCEQ